MLILMLFNHIVCEDRSTLTFNVPFYHKYFTYHIFYLPPIPTNINHQISLLSTSTAATIITTIIITITTTMSPSSSPLPPHCHPPRCHPPRHHLLLIVIIVILSSLDARPPPTKEEEEEKRWAWLRFCVSQVTADKRCRHVCHSLFLPHFTIYWFPH